MLAKRPSTYPRAAAVNVLATVQRRADQLSVGQADAPGVLTRPAETVWATIQRDSAPSLEEAINEKRKAAPNGAQIDNHAGQ